jgi:hypothetical protein
MSESKSDLIRFIDFEISSLCNAGCSVCPRKHRGHYTEFTQTYWTEQEVRNTIDTNIIKNLYGIGYCGNFGDVMGNPEVVGITKYFREHNKTMSIHVATNGGIGKPSDYAEMAKLGGIYTFGLDGVGIANELYRVNVKWDKVVKNTTEFVKNTINKDQFRIQFITWAETTDQIIPMIEFIQSLGVGKLYLRKPFTTGPKTEVYSMSGQLTHFLTEIQDERFFKYFDTTWEFEQLEQLKNEILELNLIPNKLQLGNLHILPKELNPKNKYQYSKYEFEQKELDKLSIRNTQTCSSKNTIDPADLTGTAYNLYITHNKLLMPCCYIPPNISNAMYHSNARENAYQREVLNRMLEIGFENFDLTNKTLREVFDSGILDKFVYTDLLNGTQFKLCKLVCNRCAGSGVNDNK